MVYDLGYDQKKMDDKGTNIQQNVSGNYYPGIPEGLFCKRRVKTASPISNQISDIIICKSNKVTFSFSVLLPINTEKHFGR